MKKSLLHMAIILSLPRMGDLELEYAKKEDVPEAYANLYKQVGDKYVFTAIDNLPTKKDVENLQESLRKERQDHKATKERFRPLDGLDIAEVISRNSQYDELVLKAEGKVDDKKIDQLVEARIKQRTAPLERELNEAKTQLTNFQTEVETLKGEKIASTIIGHVRKAAQGAKVVDTAMEDVELYATRLFELDESGRVVARDGVGLTPGIDPAMWLTDLKDKKPHWFPANMGGGAGGGGGQGGGSNPWSDSNWNMTEQAKILKADPEKAKRMASMHGVDPYNPVRPSKK